MHQNCYYNSIQTSTINFPQLRDKKRKVLIEFYKYTTRSIAKRITLPYSRTNDSEYTVAVVIVLLHYLNILKVKTSVIKLAS
jgi:hypothetical protein